MTKRFAFFYLFNVTPDRLMEVVPEHIDYWAKLDPPGYVGGPFGDGSGGMILFSAGGLEEAEQITGRDPFVLRNLMGRMWVREWVVKGPEDSPESSVHPSTSSGLGVQRGRADT